MSRRRRGRGGRGRAASEAPPTAPATDPLERLARLLEPCNWGGCDRRAQRWLITTYLPPACQYVIQPACLRHLERLEAECGCDQQHTAYRWAQVEGAVPAILDRLDDGWSLAIPVREDREQLDVLHAV